MMQRLQKWMGYALASAILLSSCSVPMPPAASIAAPVDEDIVQSAIPVRRLSTASSAPDASFLSEEGAFQPEYLSAATGSIDDLDLNIPTTFHITRPDTKLTTTYSKYFIMGTSDPSQPLYFDNEEVERLGTKGTFGVLADLAVGTNTFTFKQGDKTAIVTIIRNREPSPTAPISALRQSSLYPAKDGGVKAGGEIPVECIGPSGASISATFGGVSVNLQQVAQADKDVPAVFRGKLPVGENYEESATTKIGKITYTLTCNGSTTDYQSTGNMYVAGKNSNIAIRVTDFIGTVYPDTKSPGNIAEKLKEGAVDFVLGDNNEYFKLSSGYWLSKDQAEIMEGDVRVSNKLSSIKTEPYTNCEIYLFEGTKTPAYQTSLKDGVFTLTLYNTTGGGSPGIASSQVFSNVSVEAGSHHTTYKFTVSNAGKLWGYGVFFDGTTMRLRVRYKPKAGPESQPLQGVKVMLDPGHGNDPGTLGIVGTYGPNENTINLAHAYAARDALQALGATVYMTRTGNTDISLNARLKELESVDADFYISLHHNSLAENSDGNKVAGMETYYHTALSKPFADSMMSTLASAINRSNRGVMQSYYRVTLLNYSPAILTELGYLCNPVEYERIVEKDSILKVGKALADGVVRALNA